MNRCGRHKNEFSGTKNSLAIFNRHIKKNALYKCNNY